MKIFRSLIFFAVAKIFIPASSAAEGSPFADFQGNFSKHGHVTVSQNGVTMASGKIHQSFRIGASRESARLKITGMLTLKNAVRPFTALYILKKPTSDGIYVAAATNLAPGVENGFSAQEGTYVLTPRLITADIPFVFGTTIGKATLRVHLRKRTHGIQLIVEQILSTNTLTNPITWKFQGLSRR